MTIYYEGNRKVRGTASRNDLPSVPKKRYWPGLDEYINVVPVRDKRNVSLKNDNGHDVISRGDGNHHRHPSMKQQRITDDTEFEFDFDDDNTTTTTTTTTATTRKNDNSNEDYVVEHHIGVGDGLNRKDDSKFARIDVAPHKDDIKQHDDCDNNSIIIPQPQHQQLLTTNTQPSIEVPSTTTTTIVEGGHERKPFRTRKRKRTTLMTMDEKGQPKDGLVTPLAHDTTSHRFLRTSKKAQPHQNKMVTTHSDDNNNDDESIDEEHLDRLPFHDGVDHHQENNVSITRDWITSWVPKDDENSMEEYDILASLTERGYRRGVGVGIQERTTYDTRTEGCDVTLSACDERASSEPNATMETTTVTLRQEPSMTTMTRVSTLIDKAETQSMVSRTSKMPTTSAMETAETTFRDITSDTGDNASKMMPSKSSGVFDGLLKNQWPVLKDAMSMIHDTLLSMISPAFHNMIRESNKMKQPSDFDNLCNSTSQQQHEQQKKFPDNHVELFTVLCDKQDESLQMVSELKSYVLEETTKQSEEHASLNRLSLELEKVRKWNSTLETQLEDKYRLNKTLLTGLEDRKEGGGEAESIYHSLQICFEEQLDEVRKIDNNLEAQEKQLDRLREDNTRLKNQVERSR